jgi:hypothetical protein
MHEEMLSIGTRLDADFTAATPQLADVDKAGEMILRKAVHFCALKLGTDCPEAAMEALRRREGVALSYLHYSMVSQLAEYLAALDDDIRAVYVYDFDATPEDLAFSSTVFPALVHVLVWSARRTSALDSLIAAAGRALTEQYAAMIGSPGLKHLLDVQVIDDTEVHQRRGYGSLLSSVQFRPVKVWECVHDGDQRD